VTRAALLAGALLLSSASSAPGQEPSPAPPAADEVKAAPAEVPVPRRTRFVAPAYPPQALAEGMRGIVILAVTIDREGRVESVEVVRSVPPFDEAAAEAVRQWQFEPTRVAGRPVRVRHTVPVEFRLRLPDLSREAGVPELRQGVAPRGPAGAPGAGTASAALTVDPAGQVVEAHILTGDPALAEALIQAIRTWRFMGAAGNESLSFEAHATFTGRAGEAAALRLAGPVRRHPFSAPAPAEGPRPAEPAPEASPPSPERPSPPDPSPAPAPPAPTPPAAPSPAPTPVPPAAVEVPPPAGEAAPPPSPAPAAEGVSSVRDVRLGPGVPDLSGGRRPLPPPLARLAGVTGPVEVRFSVDAAGVSSVREVSGPEALKEAARQVVASWVFRRTTAERLRLRAVLEYQATSARGVVSLEE
jgi:TonB family protein